MSNKNISLRSALFLGAATAAALSISTTAAAQEMKETVVVTGSRIPNRDFISDSPIMTVNSDALKNAGSIEVSQTLASLPQVVPSLSSGSNNPPSNGQQSIDLRGLGSNRAVVLMDGRRVAPSNSDGTVDLQTIPAALIDRIEVISGGASAVYGPDAITGVVNFIMKRDFQGVQFDAQVGMSDRGDDFENSASLVMGGNFADNKGNVVISYDWAFRHEIYDSARSFANQADSQTSRSPTGGYFASASNAPSQAAVDAYFAGFGAAAGTITNTNTLGFNDDGSLFNWGGSAGGNKVYNYKANLAYPAKKFCADPKDPNNCKAFTYNFQPPNLLIVPLKRQNLMANGTYDITPDITAYMSLKFTNYTSSSSLAPTPAPTSPVTAPDGTTSQSKYIVPYHTVIGTTDYTNPFIPAALAKLLDTRPTPGADIGITTRFLALGPRLDYYTNDVFQETAGLKGKLPFVNLNFDIFASYGQVDITEMQQGNVSNSAVEELLWGKAKSGTVCAGVNGGYCDLNPFGALKFGPKSLDYIQRITKNTTVSTFTNIEGQVNGILADLPAGPLQFSAGGDYREQTFKFVPDPLLSTGDISGFNASDPVQGSVYDKEAFAELYIPIVKDLPYVESASITLGGRYTNQANTYHGDAFTWKAEGNWNIASGFTFRGSFEVATRMPNINELFSQTFQDNPILGDPCNYDSPFRTGSNGAKVTALCLAQGWPAGNVRQGSSQIQVQGAGSGQLGPETADTFTLGMSWISRESNPWLSNMNVSVDYWNIDLHSPIGINVFDILYGCYNYDGSNPNYDPANANCQKLARSSSSMSIVNALESNHGKYQLDGLDLAVNWGAELADIAGVSQDWGVVTAQLSGTWLLDYIVQGHTNSRELNFAGTIGATSPIGLNTDAALPHLKAQLALGWDFLDDYGIGTRINYIGAMKNNMTVLGWKNQPLGVGPVTGVPATFYFDLFGHWNVSKNWMLHGGINNVFDQQPRMYNPSQQVSTDPATYDIIGRRYFLALTVKY